MLASWLALWITSGHAAWSAVFVLLVAWFLAARARVLIHRYATNNDGSVLPLLNSPESDIAYWIQQRARQNQRAQAHLAEQLDQINTALRSVRPWLYPIRRAESAPLV